MFLGSSRGFFFGMRGVGDGTGNRLFSLYSKDRREPGGAVWCQKGVGGTGVGRSGGGVGGCGG